MCAIYGVPEEVPESSELAGALDARTSHAIEAGFRVWSGRERRAA